MESERTPQGPALSRLTSDKGLASAIACLLPSRAAAMAIDAAEAMGYRFVTSAHPGGFDADARIDRHRRLVEVREGLSFDSQVCQVSHHLRHVQQDAGTVLAAYEDLPLDERLAGTYLVEADALAYQAHVAAQLAQSGRPTLWNHLVTRDVLCKSADSYLRGYRKGGERIGAVMAFSSMAACPGFLKRYAAVNEEEVAHGVASHGPGNLKALATKLAMASPAGVPYPDRAFAVAAREMEARAGERPVPAAGRALAA